MTDVSQLKITFKDDKAFVPPALYASWTPQEQIAFITGQNSLGHTVLVEDVVREVNIFDIDSVLEVLKEDPDNFANIVQANYPAILPATIVSLSNSAQAFALALDNAKTQSGAIYTFSRRALSADVSQQFLKRPSGMIVRTAGDTEYALKDSEVKQLFNEVLEAWRTNDQSKLPEETSRRFTSTRSTHPIRYSMDRISIGCQTVHRWELEALAINEGFNNAPFKL